jgi:hypothetical protein
MKSVNWKVAAESIGITAIVASLIFVGLQMRQTQVIALNESNWNSLLSEIEARRAIYEFPDIWVKGNAGAELNGSEAVIYKALIYDLNSFAFYKYQTAKRLDNKPGADRAHWDMAGFLYENTGARREWHLLRDQFRRYREPHITGQFSNSFEETIRADLEVLEKTQDP